MSVADNRDEREQATRRLADAEPEALDRDLAYWAIAARDADVEFRELENRQLVLRGLHSEAQVWQLLIADEMRARRARTRREKRGQPS